MDDRQVGSVTGRKAVLLAGRQVEEHTRWMAGRYRVGDPGTRRTEIKGWVGDLRNASRF